MTELATRPWPLHPKPWPHEDWRAYVRRLAEIYGADYNQFCHSVLGLSRPQAGSLGRSVPDSALERLAAGTRVPADQLRNMQFPNILNDVADEMRAFVETDEGREWFERCFGDGDRSPS